MEGIIRMFNGRMVDVFDLRPEDVIPINFIHALSCINRYTGAAPFPISVMRHSIALANYLTKSYTGPFMSLVVRAAFLHDWSEALFNDLATPVKRNMPDYEKHEHAAQKVIFSAFKVPIEYLNSIHEFDKAIYLDEVKSTWGFIPEDKWKSGRKPLGITFNESSWKEDRIEGLAMLKSLFPEVWSGAVIL